MFLLPDLEGVYLLFLCYRGAYCVVTGIRLRHRWVRLHAVRRCLEVLYFLGSVVAVSCFALHIFAQLAVSLVGSVGLARTDIEDILLHSLGLICEILLVETEGKADGVTTTWMTAIRFTWRLW